jgi:predicted alpha-1,2-mannosidase
MNKAYFLIPAMIVCVSCVRESEKSKQEVDYVNPLTGTPLAGFKKGLEGGGTMPCVGTPFAMTNFVAQTCENKMGRMIYVYEDSTVMGFTATHQPTVWMGDYGYVSVMPQIGELKVLPEERALSFNHQDEVSKPYYYSIDLQASDKKIKGEIAAASRCGMFRFTFPQSGKSHLIIQGINLNPKLTDWANDYSARMNSLRGYLRIDQEKREICGYNPDRMSSQISPELPNFKGYFIIQFDQPFDVFGTWQGNDTAGIQPLNTEQYGTRMGAYISFNTKENEVVKVKVATSFISLEQARKNMSVEIPDWDFEKVAKNTREIWQKNLSRIKVSGASEDQKSIFYTALFHTMLFPREFSEYGKYYSAFDDQVHEGNSYNDFSLWDTFRALHPLLQFTQPERVSPMIQALLQMYREGGWLPKWPNPAYTNIMIGTHADAVIADAYVNGFRDYDINLAYEAIRKNAMVPPDGDLVKMWGDRDLWSSYEARGGLSHYHSLGYVPVDKTKESVSRTIEFGIDDYCVAQLAKDLGKTEDYDKLIGYSKNYKNLYNPETGFMTARLSDGNWHVEPPRPADVNTHTHPPDGFTEGSEWTYLFGALHDPEGMIGLMGGREKFASKLEENFAGNHYRHDNEPGHHYIYLFNYCGKPWRTQELIRKHTSVENFRNEPLGINGNDDCGQMSAWYIFGVMGFYPMIPASGMYSIGAPQFPGLVINYSVGGQTRRLEILAKNLSEENKYVQKATLDGKPIQRPFIRYKELVAREKLVFEMGPKPNYNWK